MPPLNRRSFLKGLGVGAATTLGGCKQLPVKHALPFLVPPEEITPGVSVPYASTCTACPAACGLVVTVRDGRPVKLEGHPDHPLSGGGLCAIGQAGVRELYHSERLAAPTIGDKETSWDRVDAHVAGALAGGAAPVFVLSPTVTSPTARRALEAFAAQHGGALVEWDARPEWPSAALEAWRLVTGRALAPHARFDRADVVVSFGADFLGAGPSTVANTRAWSARRAAHATRGPAQLIQLEGALSLTGAAADQRWAVTSLERRRIAGHVLSRLGGPQAPGAAPADRARADALVTLLQANRRKSLVLCGSSDPAEQLVVALINRQLNNLGTTLDVERPSLVQRGSDGDVLALEADLLAGKLRGLIVMPGADPVRQLPNGAAWGAALARLGLSVAISDHETPTTRACAVVAAAHHPLESWGDAMPRPGVLTIAQPTIRPLLKSRHPVQSVRIWSGGEGSWLDFLKTSWREHVFAGSPNFELQWSRSVSRGMAADGATTTASIPAAAAADPRAIQVALAAPEPTGTTLELALLAEMGSGDGGHAHNAWLRELPDPITKVAWVAVARVAPALADRLGVEDGDLLSVRAGKQELQLPARITPGMHDAVVGVPVGYPETNGFALSAAADGRIRTQGLEATVAAAGGSVDLPAHQTHGSSEGRPIIHQVGAYDQKPPSALHGPHYSLWDQYIKPEVHWEMVVDLDACTGCGACVVACQAENNIPVVGPEEVHRHRDLHWIRIDRYFDGDDVLFEPMMCQQCDHAPCETVCPAMATMHSSDGLNQQVYNRCVGTRYCANNCPYKMRRFNWFDYDHGEALDRMVLNPDVVVRERGIMEKCTFCVQRIQAARIAGTPDAVQPACVQSCPAKALVFGNGARPESAVSKLREDPRAFQVLSELGVLPSVTYLARVKTT